MSIRVLIVDDAPFIREVIKAALGEDKYQVVGEAKTGEEAITLFEKLRPDVTLMDIILPEANGIEATKKIIELEPDAKVIACSTLDDDGMVNKAMDAGCVQYITKPFEKEKLLEVLEEVVV